MKLFYTLMLTALLGLFGIGCEGGPDKEGGDPNLTTPTDEPSWSIYSVVRSPVSVVSGDESVELKVSECIAVTKDQLSGLKISVKDKVLCGEGSAVKNTDGSDGNDVACTARHVKVNSQDQGKTFELIDSNVTGCTKVLGAKEEAKADEEKADDSAGSAS